MVRMHMLPTSTFPWCQPYKQHWCSLRHVLLSWNGTHWQNHMRLRPVLRAKHQEELDCGRNMFNDRRCHRNHLHHLLHKIHLIRRENLDLDCLFHQHSDCRSWFIACRVTCLPSSKRRQRWSHQGTKVCRQDKRSFELRSGGP